MAELFVIPHGRRYLLYAPLARAAALVNEAVVAELRTGLADRETAAAPWLEPLRTSRMLEGGPAPPTYPASYGFAPHEVTIFPTSDCNLRCVYCYADAGRLRRRMPWPVARAAVDQVVSNARRVGAPVCIIGFHGGGEPSLHWDLVRRATDYARDLTARNGLEHRIHMASNGLLSRRQRDYISANFSSINVSVDGPRDIHDRQRPTKGGRGSFDAIMETLTDLDERKFSYGVRSTITARSVDRMPEMVDFFADTLKLTYLHFEPLFYCGRCVTTKWQAPDERAFARAFGHAMARAKARGASVFYSGARLDTLVSKFCAAAGDGFSVTPEGDVTSCFEVCDSRDPRAGTYHYGRFDPSRRSFTFDAAKLARLRELRVDNFAFCRDCFCKWHCAGDCLAKVLPAGDPVRHRGSKRCGMNRQITKLQLAQLIETGAQEKSHGQASD